MPASPSLPLRARFLLRVSQFRARRARLGRLCGDVPPFAWVLLVSLLVGKPGLEWVPQPALFAFCLLSLLLDTGAWFLERQGRRPVTHADVRALPVEMRHTLLRHPHAVRYSPWVARFPLGQIGSASVRQALADAAAAKGWVSVQELWGFLARSDPSVRRLMPLWQPFTGSGAAAVPDLDAWGELLPEEWDVARSRALAHALTTDLPLPRPAVASPRL